MHPITNPELYRIPMIISFDDAPRHITIISSNGFEPIDFHKDLEREDYESFKEDHNNQRN